MFTRVFCGQHYSTRSGHRYPKAIRLRTRMAIPRIEQVCWFNIWCTFAELTRLYSATLADPFDPRVSSSNRDAEAKVIHSHQDMPNPNTLQQSVPMPDNGCQCGPSCNCVFCTKHPTNEATRGRIGELYSIMDQQPFEESSPSSRPTSSYDGFSMMPSAFESHPGFPNQPLPHDYQLGEPQFNEMDQPDYFEMAYPVGGCANGYCRCGDNCACVGCLTHTGHLPSPLQ